MRVKRRQQPACAPGDADACGIIADFKQMIGRPVGMGAGHSGGRRHPDNRHRPLRPGNAGDKLAVVVAMDDQVRAFRRNDFLE